MRCIQPTRAPALPADAELTEAGLDAGYASGTWHEVEAQHSFIPTRAALRRYRQQYEALARDLGAEYAGWYIV